MIFPVSLSWIPAGDADTAQPTGPSDGASIGDGNFHALLAGRSAWLRQSSGSIVDSAHTRLPGIDVQELSEARAAPSAIAFSEADLFGRAIAFGDGSPGAEALLPLRAGKAPAREAIAAGQVGMPIEHALGEADKIIAPPLDREGLARHANDAARSAPNNAPVRGVPLSPGAPVDAAGTRKSASAIGGLSGLANRIAAPPEATTRSIGGTPAEAAARRFQSIGQLLPVSVTAHPGRQGMQVTARVCHIEGGDEVELERLVETTLASDGFSLGEMTLNGRRSGGKTGG